MTSSTHEQQLREEEEEDRLRRSAKPNAGIETIVVPDPDDESDQKDIISAFKKMFGAKPGYKDPSLDKEGHPILSFPEKGDAEKFFQSEARSRRMIIIDAATNTVMGYSTGEDGILYHADGRPFEAGDSLEPSNIAAQDFSLPSSRAYNQM